MLEPVAQGGSLPRGELDQYSGRLGGSGRPVERPGNPVRNAFKPLRLPLPHVGTGVHDEIGNPEERTAIEFIDECIE